MTFKKVNPKQSFPKLEESIMKFWKEEKIFEQSIENRKDSEEFNFYDGPPFATGTPHYGHILAGTIKDVIPRYQTMKGFRVDRKFGWDCHGLPIENIVEKKMEISGKDDIEQNVWVYKFNEECRVNVFTYVNEWKKTVERMGRWVDMENDYKTMDTDFMESVWWVYKTIYDKGLIYEGHRVVPYCPRCSTPLSNFEVNQGYKDKQDKSATVKFKIKGSENKFIWAWTTTPWTLVANLWLAVWEDLDYVELLDSETKETYVLARDRVSSYYKDEEKYTILREYKGKYLVWMKYEPMFDDFWTLNEANDMPLGAELDKNSFSVVPGHHVTTESGTGIVHIAPAYWEDDNLIGKEQKLGYVAHIADNGNTENLLENNWVQVFKFNEIALQQLKDDNRIIQISTIDHSYPHCWRCESPLIYRAISAWYVAVEKIRDKMVANNQKINWTPDIIKNGRFGKWVENARDWNISRNRYWGSAIPVWQNEDKSEEVCIWSVDELYEWNKEFWDITKVIFVRHGRTDFNEEGKMDYQNKASLTEEWKKQALEIAEIFKDNKIDAFYSSPLDSYLFSLRPNIPS
jgi:isoleucyl-tRNA synthetase